LPNGKLRTVKRDIRVEVISSGNIAAVRGRNLTGKGGAAAPWMSST